MATAILNIINCSLPRRIDTLTLRACLLGQAPLGSWLPHLVAFFGEAPIMTIEQFAAEQGISLADLRLAYNKVKLYSGDTTPAIEEWFGYLEEPAA